jgi:uncharacterized membrane-anchored protein
MTTPGGWCVALAALLLAALPAARAQAPAASAADAPATPEAREARAFDEARQVARTGPVDLALAGQGQLKLPGGYLFVPQPQAGDLLQAMGNPGRDRRLQGLIFPARGDDGWFMTVRYEDSGHIADDDAKDWKADELLKQYREGTEASNEERRKMGVPEIEVVGWAEAPRYDAGTHQLVWAMSSRHKGDAAGAPQGVNVNTYVLGREGYFMMNLVTGLDQVERHRPAAQALLAALAFNEGRRYADYRKDTDHTAEYGLAALVVGVAAKKLGLLALAGVFFAKFAKLIFVSVAGLGWAATRLFKRRKAEPPAG